VVQLQVKLSDSWLQHVSSEFSQDYMLRLKKFLVEEKQSGKTIYPKGHQYFQALNLTPLDHVKVVILGQDPYHGPGQAHGLSFSVPDGVAIPPSLQNIFKEIHRDFRQEADPKQKRSGNLTVWAEQGVLLLNSVLTVEQGQPASHRGRGWEIFTDRLIEVVSKERSHVVFMLWGSYAQSKSHLVDTKKHLVLTAPHPSPLSAHRGFLGCRHFSKANAYLV